MSVEVTQADYIAAQIYADIFSESEHYSEHHHMLFTQAFARYRIEAERGALERAAGIAKAGWISADYNVVGVADADMAMALCEHIETEIRSLIGEGE